MVFLLLVFLDLSFVSGVGGELCWVEDGCGIFVGWEDFVTFVSSGIPGFCPLGLRADWVADWNQGMITISWIVSIAVVVEAIL